MNKVAAETRSPRSTQFAIGVIACQWVAINGNVVGLVHPSSKETLSTDGRLNVVHLDIGYATRRLRVVAIRVVSN